MGEIKTRFPLLSFAHLGELANVIACHRNFVTDVMKVFKRIPWGKGCTAYDVVRDHLQQLDVQGTKPWLRFISEKGLAYTLVIDGVPLRVQREMEEICDVMPGELIAQQRALFPSEFDADPIVLRLEVSHRAGHYVDTISLCLFNTRTGDTLDQEIVYAASSGAALADAPVEGVVVPLARPADEPDITNFFTFPANDLAKEDGKE